MEWKKAPSELVEFIIDKMKNINCDYKKMFGYPAYFINGNMFCWAFTVTICSLRLSDADMIHAIMKDCKDVTAFEPMPGRAMKGYVVLPEISLLLTVNYLFH